jgi:hypothetical protein
MVQMQSTSAALGDVSAAGGGASSSSEAADLDSGLGLTRTYSGTTLHSTQKLLKDLFQRVVQLEQRNCQGWKNLTNWSTETLSN